MTNDWSIINDQRCHVLDQIPRKTLLKLLKLVNNLQEQLGPCSIQEYEQRVRYKDEQLRNTSAPDRYLLCQDGTC